MIFTATTCSALNYVAGMNVRNLEWLNYKQKPGTPESNAPWPSSVFSTHTSARLLDRSGTEYYFKKEIKRLYMTIDLGPVPVRVCTMKFRGWYDSRFKVSNTLQDTSGRTAYHDTCAWLCRRLFCVPFNLRGAFLNYPSQLTDYDFACHFYACAYFCCMPPGQNTDVSEPIH